MGGDSGFGRGQGDGRRWGGESMGLAGDRVVVEGGGGTLWVWQGTG